MIYVAAGSIDRLPVGSRSIARGAAVLVAARGRRRARGPGRAPSAPELEVAGCLGYVTRASERKRPRGRAPAPRRRSAAVSATADTVAVRGPAGRRTPARAGTAAQRSRPVVRLSAFAALAVYGALRWSVMLAPRPSRRLLGVVRWRCWPRAGCRR